MAFENYTNLPKRVFVTWEEGSGDAYLAASEERDELVEQSDREKVTVGTYELVKKERLKTSVVPA